MPTLVPPSILDNKEKKILNYKIFIVQIKEIAYVQFFLGLRHVDLLKVYALLSSK